jgi:hypothetical protein
MRPTWLNDSKSRSSVLRDPDAGVPDGEVHAVHSEPPLASTWTITSPFAVNLTRSRGG